MSDLLTIEGAISAGAGETTRAEIAARTAPAWDLPLAGAVLLHLALLALALLAPRLDGKQGQAVAVYPIHLYSAAEVELVSAYEDLRNQVAIPVRSLPPASPSRSEARTEASLPTSQVSEIVTVDAVPVAVGKAPLPVAPVLVSQALDTVPGQPGGNGGSSASFANGASFQAGSAASPMVLAHPLYRENPEPEYPALARRRQQEGTVVLEALVTPEGTVGGLVVHQSSGHRLLDEAALNGVKGWRFEPGWRGAATVAMKVLVPVRFGLR